ncbi:hypothetical protein CMV_022511 [Castanea mollissima]|uniref:TIR domain-containing protein n=1 Tax=Castanea mollissima TaxID=60419 RepID=A0A8J4QDR7_9ROSI|nr:hypothetical protein CMV_022511 [Castanea mollissima]
MASSHQPKDFDVFLSFRGEDTRRGFTKVQKWRDALTKAANISGWDDKNSCTDSELVEKIVEEISNSEFIKMPSNDATMQLEPVVKQSLEYVTHVDFSGAI